MTETINVVYTVDSEHAVQAAVSVASLLANTSAAVCIYIAMDARNAEISETERGGITATVSKSSNHNAEVVSVKDEAEVISLVKRLISISCDTIFDGDIREIWDFNLGGSDCGVCKRGLFGSVPETKTSESGITLYDCEKFIKDGSNVCTLPLRFCLLPDITEFFTNGDTAGLVLADAGEMYTKPVSIFFGGEHKPSMINKKAWDIYFWEKYFEYKKLSAHPVVFDKIKIRAYEHFMETLLDKSYHDDYMQHFIRDAVLAAASEIKDSIKGREVIFIGAKAATVALLCGLGITPSCIVDDMAVGTKCFEFDVKGGAEVFRGDLSGKFAIITHSDRAVAMAYHENMMRCRCSHSIVFMSCFAADDKYDEMCQA